MIGHHQHPVFAEGLGATHYRADHERIKVLNRPYLVGQVPGMTGLVRGLAAELDRTTTTTT